MVLGTAAQVQPQPERPCRLPVAKGGSSQVETSVQLCETVQAPVEQGQVLGTMEVRVDGVLRDSIPIISGESVPRLTLSGIFFTILERLTMAR